MFNHFLKIINLCPILNWSVHFLLVIDFVLSWLLKRFIYLSYFTYLTILIPMSPAPVSLHLWSFDSYSIRFKVRPCFIHFIIWMDYLPLENLLILTVFECQVIRSLCNLLSHFGWWCVRGSSTHHTKGSREEWVLSLLRLCYGHCFWSWAFGSHWGRSFEVQFWYFVYL